jgi:glycosyltransferase involved in cell wall biosynthesis
MARISILTTAYNKQNFISECIQSVIDSSFQDWEMIVLDDCSNDDTFEIVSKYAEIDSRIKLFKNDVNLGDYANRNKVVTFSTAEYIKFLDADDCIYPWAIEYILKYFNQRPDVSWALDSINQCDEKPFPIVIEASEIYHWHINLGFSIFSKAPTSSTFKRDFFIQKGGFKELPMVGDMEFWLRLAIDSKLMLLPHGLIWSRGVVNNDSESSRNNSKLEIILLYDRIFSYYLNKIEFPDSSKFRFKYNLLFMKNFLKICLFPIRLKKHNSLYGLFLKNKI